MATLAAVSLNANATSAASGAVFAGGSATLFVNGTLTDKEKVRVEFSNDNTNWDPLRDESGLVEAGNNDPVRNFQCGNGVYLRTRRYNAPANAAAVVVQISDAF